MQKTIVSKPTDLLDPPRSNKEAEYQCRKKIADSLNKSLGSCIGDIDLPTTRTIQKLGFRINFEIDTPTRRTYQKLLETGFSPNAIVIEKSKKFSNEVLEEEF